MRLTEKEMVSHLRFECDLAGGQKAWCQKHKFNESFVSEVLNGRRDVSRSMALALGFRRETMFAKVDA